MAGFLGKVTAFARSSQGKKLIKQVQTAAKDPATRAKVQAQAQELSKKLKDPATRAKVQEQAQGLSKRLKDTKGSKPPATQDQDRPDYGTPPSKP